jgi:hypothetical protein
MLARRGVLESNIDSDLGSRSNVCSRLAPVHPLRRRATKLRIFYASLRGSCLTLPIKRPASSPDRPSVGPEQDAFPPSRGTVRAIAFTIRSAAERYRSGDIVITSCLVLARAIEECRSTTVPRKPLDASGRSSLVPRWYPIASKPGTTKATFRWPLRSRSAGLRGFFRALRLVGQDE